MMTRLFKSLSEMRGLQGRALWCVLRLRPAGMGSWTRHPCAAEESWAPHWTQSVFPPHRTSRSLLINSTPETPQPSPTPPTHCQLHLTPKTQSTSMEASTTATVATGPWGAACSRLPPSRRATTVTVSDHTLHWEPPGIASILGSRSLQLVLGSQAGQRSSGLLPNLLCSCS